MSKQLNCRPSSLAGSGKLNSAKAFYFDRFIFLFGNHVENQLDRASANSKNAKFAAGARQRMFEKLMNGGGFPKKFKDPAVQASAKPVSEDKEGEDVTASLGKAFGAD